MIEIVFAKVREVTPKDNGKLLTPLLPLYRPETTHLQATICYDLHRYGIAWGEIKEKYHLPTDWTEVKVKEYIKQNGRCRETERSFSLNDFGGFEVEVTFEGIVEED